MSAALAQDGPSLNHPLRLKLELHGKGLTVTELAKGIGVSRSAAAAWSTGRSQPRRRMRERANQWLRAHGIDPDAAWMPLDPAMSDRPHLRLARPDEVPTEPPMQITSREFLEHDELEYFNLTSDPFEDSEDPEDLFLSGALQRIEAQMLATIQRRRIMALVGEPGAGKSSLLRRLYGRSSRQQKIKLIAAASLDRRRITSSALAVAILRDLIGRNTSSMAMEPRSELLRQTLVDQDRAGLYPLLLIDEAHLLKPEALLAIKQIWDSHTLFQQLGVLMVGQMPLETMLRTDPRVRELTGRTRIVRMPRYRAEDVHAYLAWRFSRVGGEVDQVFEPEAIKSLTSIGEHPLWINNIAVNAMRYARSVGDSKVTAAHVGRA